MRKIHFFLSIMMLNFGFVVAQPSVETLKNNKSQAISANLKQANADYYRLGYFETDDIRGVGFNKDMIVDFLLELSDAMTQEFVGDRIEGLRIGFAGQLNNVRAFIREIEGGRNIAEKVFNGNYGWNEVMFDTPVTIEANKKYYIGYSVIVSAYTKPIGISKVEVEDNALIVFDREAGTLQDQTSVLGSGISVQALLGGNVEHFENRVEIKKVTLSSSNLPVNSVVSVPIDIKNNGINHFDKIELTCQYADKEPMVKTFEVNIPPYANEVVRFEDFLLDKTGKISFTISKINDKAVSATPYTLNVTVFDPNGGVPRKVLLEQFTTESCPNCPYGARRIKDAINNSNLKDKVVWVAHHTGYYTDSYTILPSRRYLSFYGAGGTYAPAIMLDRTVFPQFGKSVPVNGVGIIDEGLRAALEIPAFVTVNITQENTDKRAKITVNGTYKGTVPAEDLYLNVYLTEDDIQSTSQAGAYGVYTHNNVLRSTLSGVGGAKIVWNGNNYSVTVEEDLDTSWKKENLNVTAFVAKNYQNELNNVQVLNANRVKFTTVSRTSNELINAQSYKVYAVDGKVIVDGEYDDINVYSINGKEVENKSLNKGIYLVKINSNKGNIVKKVVVF